MTDLFVRMVIPILPASLKKILKIGGGGTRQNGLQLLDQLGAG